MIGRRRPLKTKVSYIKEPRKHVFDFGKCMFIIVSVTPFENDSSKPIEQWTAPPEDLADVDKLIGMFKASPLNVPEERIKLLINKDDPTLFYNAIDDALSEVQEGIENIFIFYQGYSFDEEGHLLLLLDQHDKNKYIEIDQISRRVKRSRKKMNVVMLMDCSYAALAFNDFISDQFVLIASTDRDGEAQFIHDEKTQQQKSVFSAAVINSIEEALMQSNGYFSLSDLFLSTRAKMINSIEQSKEKLKPQLPTISSRNLPQFFQFISSGGVSNTDNIVDNTTDLRQLLASNKIEMLIQLLLEEVTIEKEEIQNISEDRDKLERWKRLQLINDNDYSREHAKIKKRLSQIIDDLEHV